MAKVIGVLGGMGPEATADFFVKIIRRTPARKDSEHLRVIIDSNPQIPDRTAFLVGRGENPLPELIATAKNLVAAGAAFLAVPCITAHCFMDELRGAIEIPVLDALELTARHVDAEFTPDQPLALLASTGTLRMGLFERVMPGRKFIIPTNDQQERVVSPAIYGPRGVKAVGVHPETREEILRYVEGVVGFGARGVIAGCTELSVLLAGAELAVALVDPMWLLAEEAVKRATE